MSTKIPYADEGWPVVTGCTHAHIGCQNCYAARLAATRLKHQRHYEGLARKVQGTYRWTGEVRLNHDVLERPLHWKKPRKVFVAQTGDLFHKDVPTAFIARVLQTITECPQHTFLVFTKRPARAAYELDPGAWATDGWPLPNLWLYTSISDQATADESIPHLLRCPAAVRGLSFEPILGPIELRLYGSVLERAAAVVAGRPLSHISNPTPPIHHIIIGCESGPGRRKCKLEWIERVVADCQAAGVPVNVKQIEVGDRVCSDVSKFPKHLQLRETAKGERDDP